MYKFHQDLLDNPPEKCITLWYRVEKDKKTQEEKLVYNHFEYGIETFLNWKITTPTPISDKFSAQKSWKNMKWFKTMSNIDSVTKKILQEFYYDTNNELIEFKGNQ